jgi:hypothetical protein
MLRGMSGDVPARIHPTSFEKRALRLLLCSAIVIVMLYQSGCSGVTSAAPNGNSVVSQNQLNASSLSLNLGNVALGDSKTVAVSFTNTTASQVTIMNISISGPGFNVSGIPTGTNLNAGQTATLSVTFTPSGTGNVTGSITITSNAQNSPITVALQASGVPAGAHLATLSWSASPSPVNGYFIYRGTSSGGPYTPLNLSSLDANTTYTDSSVQAGQSYYYVVKAVDSNNVQSLPSNEVSATIPSP